MVTEINGSLLSKIRDSDYYKSFFEDLRADHEHVEEGSCYKYAPEDLESSQYLVVVTVKGVSENGMNIVFKINKEDEILDAEANIDVLSGVGKPRIVDEYIDEQSSIKERIRSMREED